MISTGTYQFAVQATKFALSFRAHALPGKSKVKAGQEKQLLQAIESGTLGKGSVAGDEYLDDMQKARIDADGVCTWVEVCFCATPLQEERPYWEEYFELLRIKDAHARKNCRDANGTEPWACCNCDCTRKLEEKLQFVGENFLNSLKAHLQATKPRAESEAPPNIGNLIGGSAKCPP